MYMQNMKDDLPYDEPLLGPPTLIDGDLDFGRVHQGVRKTLQQVIVNTNKQPVIWLADAGGAHWITLEPDQGVLQSGERQSIQVTADTASLATGEYSATITFSSEGDETSMSRKTASKIAVEKPPVTSLGAGLNFGSLTPGSTRTLGLLINNPATNPVTWRIETGSVTWETIEPQGRPGKVQAVAHATGTLEPARVKEALILNESTGTLQPGELHTVDVTASAANLDAGNSYRTTLTVVSEAPNVAPTSVQVPILVYVHKWVHMVPLYNGGPKCPEDLPPHIQMSLPPSQASAPPPQAQAGAANTPQKQADAGAGLDFTNPDENGQVKWVLKPEASWLTVDKKDASGASVASATLTRPNDPVSLAENAKEHVDVQVNGAGLSPGSHTTNLWLILNYEPSTGHDTRIPIPVTVVIK
jgi:hypothetical protein